MCTQRRRNQAAKARWVRRYDVDETKQAHLRHLPQTDEQLAAILPNTLTSLPGEEEGGTVRDGRVGVARGATRTTLTRGEQARRVTLEHFDEGGEAMLIAHLVTISSVGRGVQGV